MPPSESPVRPPSIATCGIEIKSKGVRISLILPLIRHQLGGYVGSQNELPNRCSGRFPHVDERVRLAIREQYTCPIQYPAAVAARNPCQRKGLQADVVVREVLASGESLGRSSSNSSLHERVRDPYHRDQANQIDEDPTTFWDGIARITRRTPATSSHPRLGRTENLRRRRFQPSAV